MGSDRLSLGAMLIPTNDGFFAFQNLRLPRGGKALVQYSIGFDAGSEPNDGRCINTPGTVCGGEGASLGVDGEGYVHIHGGIHGIADPEPAAYDFRNPVAMACIPWVSGRFHAQLFDPRGQRGRFYAE